MNWRDVPLPERMQALDKDQRGLPIPFVVMRDAKTKRPYFTINDTAKTLYCSLKDLCPICGQKLLRGRWFVGGPLSAFHPQGTYIDWPTHDECAHYAVQVCPYLAAPRYTGRLDDQLFDYEANPHVVTLQDNTMLPDRPKFFVALMTVDQEVIKVSPGALYVRPKHPYRKVEFWQFGEVYNFDQGMAEVKELLTRPLDLIKK